MRDAIEKVREFHRANALLIGGSFDADSAKTLNAKAEEELGSLDDIRDGLEAVGDLAEMLERYHDLLKDPRFLRMHLILEEAAEVCQAILAGDVIETTDGLCDLAYVTVGTAVSLNLPLAEGFDEVHSSNMTKRRVRSEDDVRFRGKGPNYRPPDLAPIVKKFRECGGFRDHGQPGV